MFIAIKRIEDTMWVIFLPKKVHIWNPGSYDFKKCLPKFKEIER